MVSGTTTAQVKNVQDQSEWGPIWATTAQKGQRVLDAAKAAGHQVVRVYGYNTTPDHNNRQCVDFMHYGDTKIREWLESYLIKNAHDLGVEAIISNRRCMGFPSNETDQTTPYWNGPEGEWRDYHGPNPHTDHVHVQFNTNKPPARTPRHTMWTIKPTPQYNNKGHKINTVPKGTKLTGVYDDHQFNDGRYLRCGQKPRRVWYPIDHLSTKEP